jgi:hypothetical protein
MSSRSEDRTFVSRNSLSSNPSTLLLLTNIIIIISIMAVQPFLGPWPFSQFLDHIHSWVSKSIKIRIYETIILPVVLYGRETVWEEYRMRVFENTVFRTIFGTPCQTE